MVVSKKRDSLKSKGSYLFIFVYIDIYVFKVEFHLLKYFILCGLMFFLFIFCLFFVFCLISLKSTSEIRTVTIVIHPALCMVNSIVRWVR